VTPFAYERPARIEEALRLAKQPHARFIAGGTNLLDLMKGGVEQPMLLVDVGELPLAAISPLPDGSVRIGATVRNTDAANHPLVRERYPLLSQALLAGASAQLRNMATIGGNLLQRTRCPYFYDTAFERCNKRVPGSGCGAREGLHRNHAVLGASASCIATHPSDMAVALSALRAVVRITGPRGDRAIEMSDFHRLPDGTPQRDTVLEHGELITAVDLPLSPFADHAHYLKVRDRASYAFALVSVAAALELASGGTVHDAALAVGGVAHKPWRVIEAERALIGEPLTPATMQAAADAAMRGAEPLRDNGFKLPLARRAIVRALQRAAGLET
jgi:xanthine dehydrogenase YagS FAD-binding subunit